MPKKILIALPPSMLTIVDNIAIAEHRTRSDLIREALRRYIDNFKRENRPALMCGTSTITEATPALEVVPPKTMQARSIGQPAPQPTAQPVTRLVQPTLRQVQEQPRLNVSCPGETFPIIDHQGY